MDIEGVSVFIFMKFQEHGYIRGYYPRENYCIHIRKIHEYIHQVPGDSGELELSVMRPVI